MSGLGDHVAAVLDRLGVTADRVERWLGRPCGGCAERRAKLNQLGWIARAAVRGKVGEARRMLESLLQDGADP